jgi:hypothetical protein
MAQILQLVNFIVLLRQVLLICHLMIENVASHIISYIFTLL